MIVDGIQSAVLRGADARAPAGADPVLAGWLELGRILADAKSGRARRAAQAAGLARALPEPPGERIALEGRRRSGRRRPASGRARSRCCCRCRDARRRGQCGARRIPRRVLRRRQHRRGRSVRIYDVAERDAPSAYLQALADGSDYRRRPAHARGSRVARDARRRPRDDARAQFPAGRRAGAGSLLPVRAVARGRGAQSPRGASRPTAARAA